MGDEADADWQAGLLEWGAEDALERDLQKMARSERMLRLRKRKMKKRQLRVTEDARHD